MQAKSALGQSGATSSQGDRTAVLESVANAQLGPWLGSWMERYREVGGRESLLWSWILLGVRTITLPCTDPVLREHLAETKMMSALFVTLVDDIADLKHDEEMFEAVRRIVVGEADLSRFDDRRRRYLELTRDAWEELWKRAATYPHFKELRAWLEFDYEQVMNSLKYDLLTSCEPGAFNLAEHDAYMTHSMTIIFMATLDLCATPGFGMSDLGAMRAAFWEGQHMGRIGNTLMSWERDVEQRDVGSGVFARARELGLLTAHDILEGPAERLKQALGECDYEAYARAKWKSHRDAMREQIAKVRSVDLGKLPDAFEELYQLNLGARDLFI